MLSNRWFAFFLSSVGNWVKPNYKVELTKEDKVRIGRPSCPRWELDLVAYKGGSNEVLVVECKSYLDSSGVRANELTAPDPEDISKYKLFIEPILRETVLSRLSEQLAKQGLCSPTPSVKLCLAVGHFYSEHDRAVLTEHFKAMQWDLFDDIWLKTRLLALSKTSHMDEMAAVIVKLLVR